MEPLDVRRKYSATQKPPRPRQLVVAGFAAPARRRWRGSGPRGDGFEFVDIGILVENIDADVEIVDAAIFAPYTDCEP